MNQTSQNTLSNHRGLFITGVDTNVGKTLITAALGVALQRGGSRVGIMKPIETGIEQSDSDADGIRLKQILSVKDPSNVVTSYQFPDPLAPLAASRQANQTIDFDRIKNGYHELSKTYDLLLVEGAGGVMVPLTEHHMVRDLISFLELPCIVACKPTLGGVNHTLLTLEALRNHKIRILAVILNQTTPPTTDTEQLQVESTSQLIREFCNMPVVGPVLFEPMLTTDWEQGVIKLADDPAISELIELLQKNA
jgi:dethiobiotin synthetase